MTVEAFFGLLDCHMAFYKSYSGRLGFAIPIPPRQIRVNGLLGFRAMFLGFFPVSG